MAQAGYGGRLSSNDTRKKELIANFEKGKLFTTKKGVTVRIAGYWGDRCVVGNDSGIYNVENDFGYKFNYHQ